MVGAGFGLLFTCLSYSQPMRLNRIPAQWKHLSTARRRCLSFNLVNVKFNTHTHTAAAALVHSCSCVVWWLMHVCAEMMRCVNSDYRASDVNTTCLQLQSRTNCVYLLVYVVIYRTRRNTERALQEAGV